VNLPSVTPLADLSDETCAHLRQRLRQSGYTEDVVAEMEGIAPGQFGRDVRPVIQHVLARRGDPASALARLLAYGDTLNTDEVRNLFGSSPLDALLAAGILTADGNEIRSHFELRPFKGLWLLADDPTSGRDAVMPPAGTTHQLALVMPASIEGTVLDVGCGPGSLALVAAARGARTVVGTDVNGRAVEMARFNARLNGIAAAEFVEGDLAEPVMDLQFDLVVSQPPFIVQPPEASAITFLHGGPSGEELGQRLLAQLPHVMAPGATALVLLEALARPNEPLHTRMRPLIGDAPFDLLVLAAPGAPPALQVIAYATLEVPDGGPAYPAAARRYLEQLDRLHATDFQLALIVLRRRPSGDPGQRKLAATVPVATLGRGDAIALERLLAGIELAALGDKVLERRAVRTSPNVRWLDERPSPDPSIEPVRFVRFGAGSFGSDFQISRERYAMASALDQAASIATAIRELAEMVGEPAEAIGPEVVAFVREGLMRGLFEPASD
jgi:SAM-dependent methyltransferase